MIIKIASALAVSLILTLILECGYAFLWGLKKSEMKNVVIINIITNPIVVFIINISSILLSNTYVLIITLILEVLVVITEGIFYKMKSHQLTKPFIFSLSINCFSYFTGVILSYLHLI